MPRVRTGMNQQSIQDMNRELLLNLIGREGVCTRSRLSKTSGLRQATVTNIVNDFIRWGIVREVGVLTGEKGRRAIGISLNEDDFGVIGIRITRRNYSYGLYNISGEEIFSDVSRDFSGIEARTVFNDMLSSMDSIMERSEELHRRILAIGVAIPGPYNRRTRRIELMTGAEGWNRIPMEEELHQRYHLPVYLEQNANAAALAQYWYNHEKLDRGTLVYIADGQGIGAGIISNGELVRGSIGTAGEIGHMSIDVNGPKCICGNRGCLENYCSSIAFTKAVNEKLGRTGDDRVTFDEAAKLVRVEDPAALEAFLRCCDYLSYGIVNVINCFNPKYIMIGDTMSHVSPERMLERIEDNVKRRVIPAIYENTTIQMSLIEHDSMVNGAAILAIRHIFRHSAMYFDPDYRAGL